MRLLAQRKPGNILWGKQAFHQRIFPAFPGCFASGLAAFSGRARSTVSQASLPLSLTICGNLLSFLVCHHPQVWVQGGYRPGQGFGGGQPPTFPFCLSYLTLDKLNLKNQISRRPARCGQPGYTWPYPAGSRPCAAWFHARCPARRDSPAAP